jgi:hypothetical protein
MSTVIARARGGRRLAILAAVTLLSTTGCLKVPSASDAGEALEVSNALKERYRFPVMSKIDPTRPAAGARPGVDVTFVTVIGVVDPAEQDRVIAVLRDIRAVIATKPILVRFYREEVLTQTSPTSWQRDNLGLLRKARIP